MFHWILFPLSELRRKGSRMSMERLQRQIRVDPIAEDDAYTVPKFLSKSNSVGSDSGSDRGIIMPSKENSLDSLRGDQALNVLKEEHEEQSSSPGKGKSALDEQGKSSPSSKNGSQNQDEGLGESFDQQSQSDLSDSNQSITGAMTRSGSNGVSGMDPVPEEQGQEEETSTNNNANTEQEITLDPKKLPYSESADSVVGTQDSYGSDGSPFSSKVGSIKKVSFLWGTEEGEETKEPVSDTYVYDGKAEKREKIKSKFGLARRGKSNEKW